MTGLVFVDTNVLIYAVNADAREHAVARASLEQGLSDGGGIGFAWLALVGFAPGLGGAGVAWEAHIFGYIAGLLLIGAFGRVAGAQQA